MGDYKPTPEQIAYGHERALLYVRDRIELIANGECKAGRRRPEKGEWSEPGMRPMTYKEAKEMAAHVVAYINRHFERHDD